MRLDDADPWNDAPQAQGGRAQGGRARPLPPVQRASGTGGLGQGTPLQRDELPAWLRAGPARGQPNGVQDYGAPPPARPEPTYDEWGLGDEWRADGATDGAAGYAGYPDGYADPGYGAYVADGPNGAGQARGARGQQSQQAQPDQQGKRGWRRIFGRK